MTNSGILNSKSGNEFFAYGYSLIGGTLTNTADGIINAVGSESERDYDLDNLAGINVSSILDNYGTVNATGWYGPGMSIGLEGVVDNHGRLTAKGGEVNFEGEGLRVIGKLNNYGVINAFSGNGYGVLVAGGEFTNYGSITTFGLLLDKPLKPGAGVLLPTSGSGFSIQDGKFINKSGSSLTTTGGHTTLTHGFEMSGSSTFVNEDGAEVIATGGEGAGSKCYGFENEGQFINAGRLTLQATQALNAFVGSNLKQAESSGSISGNLLSFAAFTEGSTVGPLPTNYLLSNTKKLDDVSFSGKKSTFQIGKMATFLQSGITGGTIHITDDDWAASVQQVIKDAIYGTGVGKDVAITFAGTGSRGDGFTSGGYTVAATEAFLGKGNAGAILYESDLVSEKPNLVIGKDGDITQSFGYRTITGTDTITVKDGLELTLVGKALTLLGDGTKIAGDASGSIAVCDGTLNLGLKHDLMRSRKQGGELSTVSLADAGKLSVADVNGTYRISDKLSLADKATLTNAGKLSVASVAFAGNNATVTNTGTTVVKTASGSGKGNTLKNAGIYSQTDLSAFGDIQNKGTLKTGELKVGAADKLVNGGTILAKKITVDGLLQNRNGTFALGTAAVAKYLEKHLDLAQQLKDLGETLPTSVENLLAAQAAAESASLTTLEFADGERPVESDDEMSETTESTDFASLFGAIQAANAPQGRLATREGRLAFAGFSTYADNRAQLERQLQSGLSGLWADVIASQSEMDGYKANRSGISVGLQGTNDAGLTFGVAARYSDGKLKGDALTSENWTSAGGSTYAAWTNEDAFVSGFIGYDNLKTKGSDKLTNDVVSVGVKSGLKLAVGPVHVTPFVGGEVVHQKVKGLDAATTYRFPVGVGLTGQYETYGAWQVHPSLEVAFVPQAGDKVIDVTDKVDSCFAGNYAFESRLGIVVEKKNLMLGINYHGSAGDASLRSHSLQANVRYRF